MDGRALLHVTPGADCELVGVATAARGWAILMDLRSWPDSQPPRGVVAW